MTIKNAFKRIIALVITLLIVISAASGAIYTFAAVSSLDYTINTDAVTDDNIVAMGESLVASVEIENTLDGGATFTKQTPEDTMLAKLTDGKTGTQLELKNNPIKDGIINKGYFYDYILKNEQNQDVSKDPSSIKAKYVATDDSGVRKVRITLALKSKSNIENILLVHPGTGAEASKLATANYAVFASSNKDELYDKTKASLYHLYDNATANKKYQNYEFKADALTGISYVGIEIYNPHINWADSYVTGNNAAIFFPRINEFNVYGAASKETVVYDDGGLLSAEEKGDLSLVSSSITAKSYRNGVVVASGKSCINLLDEDLSTSVDFMHQCPNGEYAFYQKNGSKFTVNGEEVDVTVNLTIEVQPKSVVKKLVFVNSSPTSKRGNYTTKYEVYAADSVADLYNIENRIELIDNKDSKKRQIINVSDTAGLKVKYIGFRIVEAIDHDNFTLFNMADGFFYSVPRIAQLGVYGERNKDIDNAEIAHLADKNIPANIGEKLTGSETAVEVRYYKNNSASVVNKPTEYLYDGDTSTCYESYGQGVIVKSGSNKSVKTYDDGYYYEIEYDLGTYDKVENLFISTYDDTKNNGLRLQKYEIYASLNKNSLWDEESKIAYVVTNNSLSQTIKLKEAVNAKYVGMRVLETIKQDTALDTYGYLRMCEFGVYGEKGEKTHVALANDSGTISIPQGNSVVKRMSTTYKSPTANAPKTITAKFDSGKNPGYSVLQGLTTVNTVDGVRVGDSFAKADGDGKVIYRDGVTAYTDIVYTLDGLCEITDIFVAEHTNVLFKLAYKIYVSDSEDNLFDGEPLCVYDNASETRFQHYKLAGISAAYVGLRITASTSSDNNDAYSKYKVADLYPRLYGFGVLGKADTTSREPQEGASLPLPTSESIVAGVTSYYYNGSKRAEVGLYKPEAMYDGDLNTEAAGRYASSPFAYKESGATKYYTNRYVDVVLNLKGNTQLSDVYIAHKSSQRLMTREYALYIGDDIDSLFDGAAYYYCDNSDLKQIQHYTFNDTTARYVGVRITKAHETSGSVLAEESYIRLLEFNAYGTIIPDPVWTFEKVTNLSDNTLPNGLSFDGLTFLNHKDTTIRAKSTWADDTMSEPQRGAFSNSTDYIADGDYDTQCMLRTVFASYNKDIGKAVDYTKGRVRYQTVYFDLKSEADLSFINIAFPSSNPVWTAGDYEVFVGNDKDTLFDGEPYATVDNYAVRKEQGIDVRMNVIAFDKSDSNSDVARYVGIKIYNPISADLGSESILEVNEKQNHIYGRIQEIQVYGEYVDSTFDPTINTSTVKVTSTDEFGDLSRLTDAYGPNLISSKNFAAYRGTEPVDKKHRAKLAGVLDRAGDDMDGTHVDFNDVKSDSGYVIYIKLADWEMTQINGFVFQGVKSTKTSSQQYYASDYEIYVVEEKEDIVTSKPVFHYDSDEYLLTSGQIIEFSKDDAPQGNWIVFKMNNPVYTADQYAYLRLSLLYAWGEEADVQSVPANIAENMPCDISFLNGGKRTAVSESNLTAQELINITDSEIIVAEDGSKTYKTKLDTYGTINTKGKNRDALEMVYNLCNDCKIDSITVSTLIDKTNGFKVMKVYASNRLQDVYADDGLIWTYKVTSSGVINPTKAFKKALQMRYIRFVFEGTKDNVRLYTIDVIGGDNQKMKTRNLTNNITGENLSVEKIDLSTGKRSFCSDVHRTLLDNAINGNVNDFLSFEDGEVGKVGYSLIMDLCDLKTVSKLSLDFNYGFKEYWAKKIKVYVVETEAQLADGVEANYTFNPQKMSGTTKEIVMRPRLARYIKIDFLEFSKIEGFKTHTGAYKISSAIADIKITGTKVKGMQRDESDERLISFVDKKTKAEISLLKLDENDVFTNVVGVRLVPEKATNRQLMSLYNNYFKVVGKQVYKIELLDIYGNVVNDIGQREIQVRFPIKNSEKTKMLIGDASNKSKIDGLDAFEIGNWICANLTKKSEGDTKVALLKLTTASDEYWSEIGELEDFDVVEDEYRDESWYESIHTTDGRFVVTPLYDIFETGLRFTATDVTIKNAYSDYYNVLDMAYTEDETATDLQVAVFYDMRLSRNGANVELADGAFADIAYNVPAFVYNNYTDLRAFYIADTGEVTPLWSEEFDGSLTFQLEKMGKVAVVGTKIGDVDASVLIDMNASSPETGESRVVIPAVISLMVAAAFVVTISVKSKKEGIAENK